MIAGKHLSRSRLFRRLKNLALKEAALAKLKPYKRTKGTRFRPNDRLLEFLEAL